MCWGKRRIQMIYRTSLRQCQGKATIDELGWKGVT